MKIVGIDEAGRGCVIGPLVVAGVQLEEDHQTWLLNLGVRDSKRMTPQRRAELWAMLGDLLSGYQILVVPASEVDTYCWRQRLNILEAEKMASIIRGFPLSQVYLDAPGRGGTRFGQQVAQLVGQPELKIIAENHADANYPVVSAASILAKVFRDRMVAQLRNQVGDFGSGYPSDSKTQAFLVQLLARNRPLPAYVRHSWQTISRLKARYLTPTLFPGR